MRSPQPGRRAPSRGRDGMKWCWSPGDEALAHHHSPQTSPNQVKPKLGEHPQWAEHMAVFPSSAPQVPLAIPPIWKPRTFFPRQTFPFSVTCPRLAGAASGPCAPRELEAGCTTWLLPGLWRPTPTCLHEPRSQKVQGTQYIAGKVSVRRKCAHTHCLPSDSGVLAVLRSSQCTSRKFSEALGE